MRTITASSIVSVLAVCGCSWASVIADFDGASIGYWEGSGNGISTVGTTSASPISGSQSLIWTYHDDGTQLYGNNIYYRFDVNQDWSQAAWVQFDVKVGSPYANDAAMFFTYFNDNGSERFTRVDADGTGVAIFGYIKDGSVWHVYIDLNAAGKNFQRDQVSGISFYLYGGAFDGSASEPQSYDFIIDNLQVDAAITTPEPAGLGLVGMGVAGLLLKRRLGAG